MPFPYFSEGKNLSSYLFFPRKESNTENQTQPKYLIFLSHKARGVIRKQQPPFHGHQETLPVTRGNRNNPTLQRKTLCLHVNQGSVEYVATANMTGLEKYFLFC